MTTFSALLVYGEVLNNVVIQAHNLKALLLLISGPIILLSISVNRMFKQWLSSEYQS